MLAGKQLIEDTKKRAAPPGTALTAIQPPRVNLCLQELHR
jgi:hypothetical protein